MPAPVIHINDVQIEQIIYQGEPVVTFAQIAEVHGVPVINVQRSFERHAERFTPGKHYFRLDFAEASQLLLRVEANPNGLTVFTQKGYLLLTKPMKDAKSWEVQEQMVDEYFSLVAAARPAPVLAPGQQLLGEVAVMESLYGFLDKSGWVEPRVQRAHFQEGAVLPGAL